MIVLAVVILASVSGKVIESPKYHYRIRAQARHGGAAELFQAVMTRGGPASRDYSCESKEVILKCQKDGSGELFQREVFMMESLRDTGVSPKLFEYFHVSGRSQRPCMAMEKVGINLESLRLHKPGYWPSITLVTRAISF